LCQTLQCPATTYKRFKYSRRPPSGGKEGSSEWVGDASLLALAALLPPAGVLADGIGRTRTVRFGLARFIAASLGCATAASGPMLLVSADRILPRNQPQHLSSDPGGCRSVPESCAGVASGLHHASVRAGGLIAIALLGSLAAVEGGEVPTQRLKTALMVCAAVIAVIRAVSARLVDDRAEWGSTPPPNRRNGEARQAVNWAASSGGDLMLATPHAAVTEHHEQKSCGRQ
jgi:MFS family permease